MPTYFLWYRKSIYYVANVFSKTILTNLTSHSSTLQRSGNLTVRMVSTILPIFIMWFLIVLKSLKIKVNEFSLCESILPLWNGGTIQSPSSHKSQNNSQNRFLPSHLSHLPSKRKSERRRESRAGFMADYLWTYNLVVFCCWNWSFK